jgi:hypothetical protein
MSPAGNENSFREGFAQGGSDIFPHRREAREDKRAGIVRAGQPDQVVNQRFGQSHGQPLAGFAGHEGNGFGRQVHLLPCQPGAIAQALPGVKAREHQAASRRVPAHLQHAADRHRNPAILLVNRRH